MSSSAPLTTLTVGKPSRSSEPIRAAAVNSVSRIGFALSFRPQGAGLVPLDTSSLNREGWQERRSRFDQRDTGIFNCLIPQRAPAPRIACALLYCLHHAG